MTKTNNDSIDNKTCCSCKKAKPRSDFWKNRRTKDGLNPLCKACKKEKDKAWRETPKAREYNRKRQQDYRSSGSGKEVEKKYSQTEGGKFARQNAVNSWKKRNLDKRTAHQRLNYMIRVGRMKKPSECEECGRSGRIEGHHHSYEEKYWYDVKWLCTTCHTAEHKRLKEEV
jgi:hypothetical protein